MNWPVISPLLVNLFSSLAADDISVPLADGHVVWLNRSIPFIGTDTMTGIYLKVTTTTPTELKPATVWVSGTDKVTQQVIRRGMLTLQVQAKSLEDTDYSWALHWLENVHRNIWAQAAHDYLTSIGLGVRTLSSIVNHDAPVDDRMASIATTDVLFNYVVKEDLSIAYSFIEHVRGVARPTGHATLNLSADKPTG